MNDIDVLIQTLKDLKGAFVKSEILARNLEAALAERDREEAEFHKHLDSEILEHDG